MKLRSHKRLLVIAFLITMLTVVMSGCNLGAPENNLVDITNAPTNTGAAPTRTLLPTGSAPTSVAVTSIPLPTQIPQQFPTSVVQLPPTAIQVPTNTPVPISIVIISPLPGNIIAGNVQIRGSAVHPEFLQYRVEFGPDPNPNNLWFPITGVVQTPVTDGVLGIWNTTTAAAPDGVYQIRLRVFLRDGREQSTVINNVRILNQQPTPIPTNTPNIPRPIAAFTQNYTSGNAPLVVSFTNLSQGQIDSNSWDFGDGGNSNKKNPTHTFKTPGLYTVKLTVKGPGGKTNVTRQINVKSPSAPVANFNASPNSGTAPLTVNFTNTTTGNATSYSWSFGDGETSTSNNPSHTYSSVGTYNVILDAKGPGGSTTAIRQVTVNNPQIPAPVASFDVSTEVGQVPLTMQLSNTSTGQINNYLWDFDGDNITDSVDEDPTFIYDEEGEFTIKLTVIGPGGQSSASKTITAENPPDAPVANFTANPETGDAPLTVAFTNTTTGDATGYVWDFQNDGQPDSTDSNPSFTFNDPGTYEVKLTSAGDGGSTNVTKTITVTTPIEAPIASFDADPTIGEAPLTVVFTNQSQGSELTFEWDFESDGTVDSTDNSPSHEFDVADSYTVSLTVSNSAGTDTATATINVSDTVVQQPPTAAFTASPLTGTAPLQVTFTNQSIGDITSYEWDFQSDGTIDSTDTSPSHTFAQVGTYTVKLKAIGPGGSNEITSDINVTQAIQPPVAGFTASPTNLTVAFSSTATGDNLTYLWDFGDGNTSTNASPTHTYASANTFNVTQTVSNSAGSNSTTQQVTVTAPVQAPVAGFNASPTNLTVAFSSTATGDNLTYLWDFGDGNTSTNASPTHTYASANTFNVTQTVSNSAGSNSTTQQVTVTAPVQAPVAGFTASPTNLTVAFSSTATGDNLTYLWDFGDGNTSTNASPTHTYASANTFNVTQTVSNSAGSNSTTQQITVSAPVQAPVAGFTALPTDLTVAFSSTATGDNLTYLWDFGDGNTSTNASPTHTYASANTYNVMQTVSNSAGSNSTTQQITVTAPVQPPVAGFNAIPTELDVAFSSTATGSNLTYLWDFGDGNSSTDANPTHLYGAGGTYNVTQTVSNSAGSNSVTQQVTVAAAVQPPVAGFNAIPTDLSVAFTSTAVGENLTYLWDFGDGNSSTEPNPSYTYAVGGAYNVTQTVTNAGGSNSSTQQITVTEPIQQTTSPTGNVAFVTNRDGNNEIYVMNADGTDTVNVTNNPSNDNQPDWSPDGSKIVFVSDRDGDRNIFVLAIDTLEVTRLTNNSGDNRDPEWSPDGSKIVFTSDRFGDNDVFVMDSNGSSQEQRTFDTSDDNSPTWSPDGNQIAYVSNSSGNLDIYVITSNDGTPVLALTTDPKDDYEPAWLQRNNTTALLFTSNRFDDEDIFVINPTDASGLTQITTDTSNESQPAWSADGNSIIFVSDRDNGGEQNIYTMSVDGNNITRITPNGSNDRQPSWK